MIDDNRQEITRFLKFSVVGTVGAFVDFGVLYLLHSVLHIDLVISNTVSFTAAVLSNFTWNRYYTYPDSRSKPIGRQLIQFFVVNIVGWGLNTGILVLLLNPCVAVVARLGVRLDTLQDPKVVYDIGYNLAKFIATSGVLFWNFFVNRFWTYSDVT